MKTEEIFAQTADGWDIFAHYFRDDFRLGKAYRSPLREDRHPSFSLFRHKVSGRIYFKDFAEDYGDGIAFVQALYQLNFSSAVEKIKNEVIGQSIDDSHPRQYRQKNLTSSVGTHISIVPRDYNKSDLAYFARYGITQDVLESYQCQPVERYQISYVDGKSKITYVLPASPVYAFEFITGHFKLYEPFADKGYKWRSNTNSEDIFGAHLLKNKEPVIFFCAGQKDTMSFHALTGLAAISLPSEMAKLTLPAYHGLKAISENLYCLFDNDATGRRAAERMYYSFSITAMDAPLMASGEKDFADLVCSLQADQDKLNELRSYYEQLIEVVQRE